MGQLKFEKEIGGKLKNREIKPKAKSWDQLSARLEKEDKKSRSIYWYSGLVASVIAGLLILGQVYKAEIVEDTPAVVETPGEVQEESKEDNKTKLPQVAIEEISQPEVEEKGKPVTTTFKETAKKPARQEVVAVRQESPAIEPKIPESLTAEQEEIASIKLEEVIASVSGINSEGEMADSEVDALLYKAAAEISQNRVNTGMSERIDASALLMDVEMELEHSFREKVFEVLKEGYLKARTAVANRNN